MSTEAPFLHAEDFQVLARGQYFAAGGKECRMGLLGIVARRDQSDPIGIAGGPHHDDTALATLFQSKAANQRLTLLFPRNQDAESLSNRHSRAVPRSYQKQAQGDTVGASPHA